MGSLSLFRLLRFPIRRLSVSKTTKLDENQKVQEPHIYKKTYTREKLIQYVLDNTVYNSEDHIVSSVPQGCYKAGKNRGGAEKDYVSDHPLDDLLPALCREYNEEILVLSKYPQRHASGLLILSKSYQAHEEIRGAVSFATKNMIRVFEHLALVVGAPKENMIKTFSVSRLSKGEECVSQVFDSGMALANEKKTKYKHKILQSTGQMSLLKISTSYDMRDCVRNILWQSCFTPVFGDSLGMSRAVNFLFGVPLVQDVEVVKSRLYEFSPDLLEKLQLTEKELNCIPIHLHSYGVTLKLYDKRTFFCFVPPPDYFIWTCERLGLDKIRQFTKTSLEVSG